MNIPDKVSAPVLAELIAAANYVATITPRSPLSITHERGWLIIDAVQDHLCKAVDNYNKAIAPFTGCNLVSVEELNSQVAGSPEQNQASPSIDDKPILGTPVLNFADVDREHSDLRETLEYADSSKLEIRDRAQGLLTALNELKEQRQGATAVTLFPLL